MLWAGSISGCCYTGAPMFFVYGLVPAPLSGRAGRSPPGREAGITTKHKIARGTFTVRFAETVPASLAARAEENAPGSKAGIETIDSNARGILASSR